MSSPFDDWFSGCLPALTGLTGSRAASRRQQAYTGNSRWHVTTTTTTTTTHSRPRQTTSCKGCGAPAEDTGDRCEYCGRRA